MVRVRRGRRRSTVPGSKDAYSPRELIVEIPFRNEILMLPVRAVGTVVGRFAFDRVFPAPLTAPEGTRVGVAKDGFFMIVAATTQLVLDFVELVHFLSIFLLTELCKRRVVLGAASGLAGALRDTLKGAALRFGWSAFRGVTSLLMPSTDLATNPIDAGILLLLVLALEFKREAVFDFGVQEADTVAYAFKTLKVEPISHSIT